MVMKLQHKIYCLKKIFDETAREFEKYSAMKRKNTYDLSVDYDHARSVLLNAVNGFYKCYKETRKKLAMNYLVYSSILLIQLENASRVSEAVEAFVEYIKTKNKYVNVRVRKKKTMDYREIVIPSVVEKIFDDVEVDRKIFDDVVKLTNRVKKFATRININTHSLRYARITFFVKNNVPVSVIAKITHHSNLNYVLYYTESRIAQEMLRGVVE